MMDIPREAIELTMERQEWSPKRELGKGHWDRKLMQRIVELSVADNYDDAKHEWRATGDVYWGDGSGAPKFALLHPNYCLCGHSIVYHFEIENTENGHIECVGSDHINSYMIMKAIANETNLKDDEITDEMIEQWVSVRVESMKKDAWWARHGESFTNMFNAVKDLDLRVNVRDTGKRYWDNELRMKRSITKLRKRGSGTFGLADYEMASIVWRWNHPDNSRNQQSSRGYPNDALMNDLALFFAMKERHTQDVQTEDNLLDARRRQIELSERMKGETKESKFAYACENYGFRVFSEEDGINAWERNFLSDMKKRLSNDGMMSDAQASTLHKILTRASDKTPATEKQRNFLKALGYGQDTSGLSKYEASVLIDKIRNGE